MEIKHALHEAMKEAGWNAYRLSREADVREGAAYKWLRGGAAPGGPTLLILMHKLPGFAEKLGFRELQRAV